MGAPKLLIADRGHDAWYASLVGALGLEPSALEHTTDGNVLQAALTRSPAEHRLVVIGDSLSRVGGLDALFLATEARKNDKTSPASRPIVALVTDVRADSELLALWRKKGIASFIYRDASIDDTVRILRDGLYASDRVEPRMAVNVKVAVSFQEREVGGTMEDLSASGACVALPAKKLPHLPQVGETIVVAATIEDVAIRCNLIIRRLELRKALLGDRVVIGGSFVDLDFDARKALETAIERARRAAEDPVESGGPSFGP
jgi:hypothetical protein